MNAAAQSFIAGVGACLLGNSGLLAAETKEAVVQAASQAAEVAQAPVAAGAASMINPLQSGFLVASILGILIAISIATWAIAFAKFIYLRKLEKFSDEFSKEFSKASTLEGFNRKLVDFSYSPLREIFRISYRELSRSKSRIASRLSEQDALGFILDNVNRSLEKGRIIERQRMERFLSLLAISASVSPFIGLFGTVWGIITAFDGIARSGSASLAAVAPGISEALVATAFGLAAAIPAAIGYNLANSKIRRILTHIDCFGADFLNLVESQVSSHGLGASGEATASSKARS